MNAKKIFEIGGYIAAAVLIAFGIASLVLGVNGRNEVRKDVQREYIVGSPDMNKTAILAEAKEAKLPAAILATLPTCNVAGKAIDTGTQREVLRLATCGSTRSRRRGGNTYAQMGRFADQATARTRSTRRRAPIRPESTKQPVENGARDLWVTETALTTALNTSFFAEQVSMFGIVVGIALVLSASASGSSRSRPSAGCPPRRPG